MHEIGGTVIHNDRIHIIKNARQLKSPDTFKNFTLQGELFAYKSGRVKISTDSKTQLEIQLGARMHRITICNAKILQQPFSLKLKI